MTLLSYSNADSLFTNYTADEDGAVVLARYNDIKTFLNNNNLDCTNNIDPSGVFPWTARHSWTINDTANHNITLIVAGVMAASKYGSFITSSAAQVNAPLVVRSLTNASSSVSVEEIQNAGTGDSHKVVNTNTGGCYHASTTSTGQPYKATVRTLTDLNAPLVSKVITTPTSVTNDDTETIVNDVTITLPADFLKVGTTIKGSLYGTLTTPGAGPATLDIRVKLGGTAGTVLLDSGEITPTVSLVSALIKLDYILTCVSVGAAGTIEAQGLIMWNSNTAPAAKGLGVAGTGNANTAPIVIDTTTQKDLILSLKWGSAVAGCTVSINNGVIEIKR